MNQYSYMDRETGMLGNGELPVEAQQSRYSWWLPLPVSQGETQLIQH